MPNYTIENPLDLLSTKRFDVMFKYMYAKSRKLGYKTKFFRDAYKHHLQIWNNFKEYNNPDKNTYEAFVSMFHDILDSIEKDGFQESISSVPVLNGSILNGAHRLAACMVYNKPIVCHDGVDGRDGAYDCSWHSWSRSVEFGKPDQDFCDRAALEYVSLEKNTYMVILFPSASQKNLVQQTRQMISNNGELFYEKAIQLNKNGAINLMRELYWREVWAESNGRSGYNEKAALCFTTFEAPTVVFLAKFNSLQDSVKCKADIRSLYGPDKHSVHINDTHEETSRIAKTVFNKNSIHYLNNCNYRTPESIRLENLITEFSALIKAENQDPDNYCISAGAVLSRFALKECKDLDYLHSNAPKLTTSNPDIQSHNNYGVNLYHTDYDDIIYNPENYFHVHGVKFASLNVVKQLKLKRSEPKDKHDLELIERVL